METTQKIKLKKRITFLALIFFTLAYMGPIRAQNEQEKNNRVVDSQKIKSKRTAVKTSKMKHDKTIVNETKKKGMSTANVEFVLFKLVDENGNDIPPNQKVTLKNGEIVTAQEAMNRKIAFERKRSKLGESDSKVKKKIDNYSIVRASYVKIKNDQN